MPRTLDDSRSVLRVAGADARDFLQGLVTNDVTGDAPVYAALLTPQGKYLADFFVVPDGDDFLVDVDRGLAPALLQRLNMYKLRAAVTVEETPLAVTLIWDEEGGTPDPRDPRLGQRLIGEAEAETDEAALAAYEARRIELGVPRGGMDLLVNDSFILEMGFEALHGVDFRKGCYVGQEVVARMKHKTELRKGLVAVDIDGEAEPGTEIIGTNGKIAGDLRSVAGGSGLAYLRFDRSEGEMTAGSARITRRG